MALHLLVVDDLMQRALRRDCILEIDYTHERHFGDDTVYLKYMFTGVTVYHIPGLSNVRPAGQKK